jgi:predicted anti-sigma-YlaC factor YlaD
MSQDITCKQAVDLISRNEENKITAAQHASLLKHLDECSLCRVFSSQNKLIGEAFANCPENAEGLTDQQKAGIIKSVLL